MQHPKKLAIFVEGQTEQIFVEKLLLEIVGYKQISIEIRKFSGGKSNRKTETVKLGSPDSNYYVLLYDCGSYSHVLSDIRKQYISLNNNGYSKIIGLRDLEQTLLTEISKLEKSIQSNLKPLTQGGIPVSVCLAVKEIEAWFLSEWNHFLKIDSSLTLQFIEQNCGFNPQLVDVEQRLDPSEDLNFIYNLVNKTYSKNANDVQDIVNNLDYEFIYLDLVNTVKYLGYFIKEIDKFLI
ncbi:DUF4276 family protein [Anabaena azotica]|uniref:DUF4276 family protein n=1 Tax=Anabaena azotica FACHB-119 TaxID=947527 RepID=A0ABR8D296_9NOST|nr:DUF4276 family protein [Anabaena azotica]MBD2501309.1 DUF4276 family protein [Anabaena azotica FACHB-119]